MNPAYIVYFAMIVVLGIGVAVFRRTLTIKQGVFYVIIIASLASAFALIYLWQTGTFGDPASVLSVAVAVGIQASIMTVMGVFVALLPLAQDSGSN